MRLALFNVKNTDLFQELKTEFDVFNIETLDDLNKTDAIYFDWIGSNRKSHLLSFELKLAEKCYAKKIPMIFFDRNFDITTNEFKLFKKIGATFFEPAVDYRPEFIYLPHSIKIENKNSLNLNSYINRKNSLFYANDFSDKMISWEKYVKKYFDVHEKRPYLLENMKEGLKEFKCTIILGSTRDYKTGHLHSSFFDALKEYCIPLIPSENRYYNGFNEIVVDDHNMIASYINIYEKTSFGFISYIYDTIEKKYQEMDIKYTIFMIKNALK